MSTPYTIAQDGSWILCGACGSRSFNSNDVEQHYCGHCCAFLDTADVPPEESAETLLCYILRHEARIFVREYNEAGELDALSLASLPPELRAHYMAAWVRNRYVPARTSTNEEISEREKGADGGTTATQEP